jgi:hypothetical protein
MTRPPPDDVTAAALALRDAIVAWHEEGDAPTAEGSDAAYEARDAARRGLLRAVEAWVDTSPPTACPARERCLAAVQAIRMLTSTVTWVPDLARAGALERAAMQVETDREAAIAMLAAGLQPGDHIWGEAPALPHLEPPGPPSVEVVELPEALRQHIEADHLIRWSGETDAAFRARILAAMGPR